MYKAALQGILTMRYSHYTQGTSSDPLSSLLPPSVAAAAVVAETLKEGMQDVAEWEEEEQHS